MLSYNPFLDNDRILAASRNRPPMKPGEPDREAVRILQNALIKAGFPIAAGATGIFGPQTSAAICQLEAAHGLAVDEGIAGREVFDKLDEILTTRHPLSVVAGALLRLTIMQTSPGLNPVSGYIAQAVSLLTPYGIALDVQVLPFPLVKFQGLFEPLVRNDVASLYKASLALLPAHSNRLRVIMVPFSDRDPLYFGQTDGGSLPLIDGTRANLFVSLANNRIRGDQALLLHEMIHAATGWTDKDHDPDPASVFSVSSMRTVLKPEHANVFGGCWFSSRPGGA